MGWKGKSDCMQFVSIVVILRGLDKLKSKEGGSIKSTRWSEYLQM